MTRLEIKPRYSLASAAKCRSIEEAKAAIAESAKALQACRDRNAAALVRS